MSKKSLKTQKKILRKITNNHKNIPEKPLKNHEKTSSGTANYQVSTNYFHKLPKQSIKNTKTKLKLIKILNKSQASSKNHQPKFLQFISPILKIISRTANYHISTNYKNNNKKSTKPIAKNTKNKIEHHTKLIEKS